MSISTLKGFEAAFEDMLISLDLGRDSAARKQPGTSETEVGRNAEDFLSRGLAAQIMHSASTLGIQEEKLAKLAIAVSDLEISRATSPLCTLCRLFTTPENAGSL